MGNCFRCYFRQISISLAFKKSKKDCKIFQIILVPDFCPLKTEIARFSIGFRLKPYIQEQLKKACAKAAALCKLCKFIPQDVMICLYKAYILPHLEYCSPLLLGISNELKNKLEDTNYYILRYSSSVSYDFLLNLAELQNLETRRQFQSLVILYKCLRGQGPEYLSEFFNILNVHYNLRGASTHLMLPFFNLEYMHKSYLTTKLWNGFTH